MSNTDSHQEIDYELSSHDNKEFDNNSFNEIGKTLLETSNEEVTNSDIVSYDEKLTSEDEPKHEHIAYMKSENQLENKEEFNSIEHINDIISKQDNTDEVTSSELLESMSTEKDNEEKSDQIKCELSRELEVPDKCSIIKENIETLEHGDLIESHNDDHNPNIDHKKENLNCNIDTVGETCHVEDKKTDNATKLNEINSFENSDDLKEDNTSESDNFVDILGNGLLTKKIITHGLGRETRPTHGDSVTIKYKGWNSRKELIDENEVSFVLGDGDMIQAFDLGICLAERHEEFELKTDARFAYGSYGWEPLVKPNESLTYHIKLTGVDDPPDFTTFSHADRMDAADVKRERGNYLYRREEYSLAVNSYSRAIKIIETDPDYKRASTDPSKVDMYDLFVKVTNNLAAAQLKLESYDNVIETCNTILNYDANNVKALFRKGKSLTMKGSYDEAIPILKRALELENSKLIAGEIQRCYQLKRADDEQRARVCRKMFGTGVKETTDKGPDSTGSRWKKSVYRYSPYIGAVLITGISVMLASIAIAKSKGN